HPGFTALTYKFKVKVTYPTTLLEIIIMLCSFSVYLHNILKNHTAHACEGDTLVIECPSRTSVAVVSAFYGRRVPNQHLCPSANTTCLSSSALRKVSRRCHSRANCSLVADTQTFGDPCFPGTRKHLRVNKNKNQKTFLSVPRYLLEDVGRGSTDPFMISDYTHGERKQKRCTGIVARSRLSPDPSHLQVDGTLAPPTGLKTCSLPTIWRSLKKYWGYTGVLGCVSSKYFCPLSPFRYKNIGHISVNCIGTLFTCFDEHRMHRSLPDFPERVALYFVSGICAGLVFLLCLFGIRSTLVRDVKNLAADLKEELKASRRKREELMEDLFDDDVSDTSSFRRLTQSYRTTEVLSASTLAVEMVDREAEQTRDLPNGDIWPHRDSSPYAIHKIKTYNH
uniref:Si:ch73-335m24.2 n=1 Tax=Gasterosteus aculeatus aculeatus TaxID=481459 RepID=A0AAQ4RVD4_GASAC